MPTRSSVRSIRVGDIPPNPELPIIEVDPAALVATLGVEHVVDDAVLRPTVRHILIAKVADEDLSAHRAGVIAVRARPQHAVVVAEEVVGRGAGELVPGQTVDDSGVDFRGRCVVAEEECCWEDLVCRGTQDEAIVECDVGQSTHCRDVPG